MNFKFIRLKSFRLLLFPFSLVYGLVVSIRNYLFDKNILKSVSFELPVICVGNLSAGGTGKSPMVEYLLTILKLDYKPATVSRGYKRSTTGYVLADIASTPGQIGDEPMQFNTKFPEVAVAVGEDRVAAISSLLCDRPYTDIVILDDALQHRRAKAGLNILLTGYDNLFTHDFLLPAGNLRDQRSSYKRADIIVVTKSPAGLKEKQRHQIFKEIRPLPDQEVFFAALDYGDPYHIITRQEQPLTLQQDVLLVCGIANPLALETYIKHNSSQCHSYLFADHYLFTAKDIKEIRKRYDEINSQRKIIITTEKDAVKLAGYAAELIDIPLFVLPVKHRFLFSDAERFNGMIHTFIDTFHLQKSKYGQKT